MQWRGFDWPLLWDPFNLLELPAVPITMFVDKDGVIRLLRPRLDKVAEIATALSSLRGEDARSRVLDTPVPSAAGMSPPRTTDARAWSDHAVALALWGGTDRLDEAIIASAHAIDSDPEGRLWFRHGVLHRLRHDSAARRPDDFVSAVAAWTQALHIDPNNYIWRRRLQQYGPRLAKPYSFYDWVRVAKAEITARGESPTTLDVEPVGAEYADPSAVVPPASSPPPLPDSRMTPDETPFVNVDVTAVPAVVRPGDRSMLHVEMTPTGAAHWNNEAGPMNLWVTTPEGWNSDPAHAAMDVPATAVSNETRRASFDVEVWEHDSSDTHVLLTLLYAVCEDETGTCLVRRREVSIQIDVDASIIGLADE